MEPAITSIKAAIIAISAKIADIAGDLRPSYSVEGQSFTLSDYVNQLLDALKALQEMLVMLEPWEIRTTAVG